MANRLRVIIALMLGFTLIAAACGSDAEEAAPAATTAAAAAASVFFANSFQLLFVGQALIMAKIIN